MVLEMYENLEMLTASRNLREQNSKTHELEGSLYELLISSQFTSNENNEIHSDHKLLREGLTIESSLGEVAFFSNL